MIFQTKINSGTGKEEFKITNPVTTIKNLPYNLKAGNGLTGEDIKVLSKYNSEFDRLSQKASQAGTNIGNYSISQMAANKVTKDASPAVQNIIKNANGAKIALGDLQLAAKATRFAFGTLKTIGNAFVFAAIVKGLELVVSGIKKVIFARKEASEKADEEYEKSSEKVKQNEEEAKSLDNLIKKYEELRSKDDVDTSARSEIKQVQYDIAALVGKQASNLDLVNGKLDDQLSKLKKIKANELKKNVEDAEDSYNKAKNEEKKAIGKADDYGNDVVNSWNKYFNDRAYVAKNIPGGGGVEYYKEGTYIQAPSKSSIIEKYNNAAGKNIVRNSFSGKSIVIDTSDISDINEKIEALKNLKDYIGKNGEEESDLYNNISEAIHHYEDYTDSTSKATTSLIDSIISQETNNMPTVDSSESYENARQKILSAILSNNFIKKAINEGDITEDELKSTVNSEISTLDGFGEYYDEWKKKYVSSDGETVDDILDTIYKELDKEINPDGNNQDVIDELKEELNSLSVEELKNLKDNLSKLPLYIKQGKHKAEKQSTSAQQNLEDEYAKISEWGLDDYADQIKDGTIQTKFGNVDMDKRTIIQWSDELKQTYADELASWNYDPEIGSIDTVFGGSKRFGEDLDGNGWEIAFTPILPDGTFLSKDTVDEYINSILAEAYADDGKVTEDELVAIDAQGRQIGNTFVKGIFAGIDDSQDYDNNGNWAEVIGRLMHFVGFFGAIPIAKRQISDSERAKEDDSSQAKEATQKTIKDAKKSSYDSTSSTTFSDMFIASDDNDSTKTELIESYQKLFTNIENVKTAFQTLKSAQEEYNTSGSLSIDTIKSLMETGDDWLNYLTVEDGQLKINEQGYVDLAKAKLNALKTEMYTSIQKQIEGLQNAGQANDWVNEQNGNLANSYDDLTSSIKASTLATLENKLATADDDAEKQKWQSAIESAKNAFDKIDKLVNDQNPIETGVTVTGSDSEFSNRINQIKEHASLINSISDDIKDKGKITMDTLTSISSAFPKLESYIEDYMNGVEGSQEALTNALKECYEQDLENYKEYLKVKYTNDSSFWQQYVNNCGDSINQLANQYGIDLKNYSTYTEAMQVMNNKLIESNEAVANARRLAMNLMTGTATSSATVAGLNSTQKTAIDNVWQQLVNEYSSGQVSEDSYSTIEQRLLNLNLGINQNIAKNLAAQFRQQLVHLPKSTILDSLKTEVESGFDGYVANYVDNFDLSSLSLDSLKEDSSSSKEDFDWVETKINRLSEALERLKDKASDTYSTWSTRNASLQQAIATTQNAIDLQSQAYQTYMNKANSIGLSDTYKTLVQNGALRIDTIYDEDLKEKISDYQEW